MNWIHISLIGFGVLVGAYLYALLDSLMFASAPLGVIIMIISFDYLIE